jgi:hypothetical protein
VEKLFREKNVPFGLSEVVVVEMQRGRHSTGEALLAALVGRGQRSFCLSVADPPRGFAAIAVP